MRMEGGYLRPSCAARLRRGPAAVRLSGVRLPSESPVPPDGIREERDEGGVEIGRLQSHHRLFTKDSEPHLRLSRRLGGG